MSPLVTEGLDLAIIGMGSVFVFLTLLILATVTMSWLVSLTLAHELSEKTTSSIGAKKLAAIAAAIRQHRNQ